MSTPIVNEGRDGYGISVTFKVHGSSDTATEVILLKNVKTGGLSTAKVDWTHSKSPNRTKQYKAGMNDPQETEFDAHWSYAAYVGLQAAQKAGVLLDFTETLPAGPNGEQGYTETYTGFITKCDKEVDGTGGDPVGMTYSVQPGAVTSAVNNTPLATSQG